MIKRNILIMCLMLILIFSFCCCFASTDTKIVLSDEEITVSGEKITSDNNEAVYLTNKMNNGGTSEEAESANINVKNIINIKDSGTYEFSGTLSDGQISIDTNDINGDVIILLNNANITCENAPAIFVYNKATKSDTCNVIIKTAKDSKNYISGGLIKQSVEGWSDQEKIVYSVEKNYNDEGQYFERYKYDGAISSDISLTFEGEGTLEIVSQREGIEVKRDITFNSGNYIINSTEDGINAAQDNESIITINGGKIVVNTSKDGPQGDGIDSNGYIYINGGEVYAFANPTSQDSGLDSDLGIYINGGKIVATGNMYDEIKEESKQKSITYQLDKQISTGTLITLVDENENPVIAFETDRTYSVITFSDEGLEDKEYSVYEGGTIEGESENGLYTNIFLYKKGNKLNARKVTQDNRKRPFDAQNDMPKPEEIDCKILVIIGIIGIICFVIAIVLIINRKNSFLVLILGILVGVSVTILINTLGNSNKNQFLEKNFENVERNIQIKNNGNLRR